MMQLRLAVAVVAGLSAAYTNTAMRTAAGGVEIELERSTTLRVNAVSHAANRRNLALSYPGKTVAFA